MKWYTDYLSTYEKPYSELPPDSPTGSKKELNNYKPGILWFR